MSEAAGFSRDDRREGSKDWKNVDSTVDGTVVIDNFWGPFSFFFVATFGAESVAWTWRLAVLICCFVR
jgi:hypothetical protein